MNRENNQKSRRGFAAMNPEEQRAIASKGGKAAHAQGKAHEWSSAEAEVAGRKGGSAPRYTAKYNDQKNTGGEEQNNKTADRNEEDDYHDKDNRGNERRDIARRGDEVSQGSRRRSENYNEDPEYGDYPENQRNNRGSNDQNDRRNTRKDDSNSRREHE